MKSEVLQIRLTKEEKDIIQKISREHRMNMSEFLLYGAMKLIAEYEFYNKPHTDLINIKSHVE